MTEKHNSKDKRQIYYGGTCVQQLYIFQCVKQKHPTTTLDHLTIMTAQPQNQSQSFSDSFFVVQRVQRRSIRTRSTTAFCSRSAEELLLLLRLRSASIPICFVAVSSANVGYSFEYYSVLGLDLHSSRQACDALVLLCLSTLKSVTT